MTGRSLVAREIVDPRELVLRDAARRLERDDGVEHEHAHAGQHDLAIARLVRLAPVAVVVAAHRVEAIAERAAVEASEGGVLVVLPVGGEIALHDHRRRIDGADLGDRARVHHLGVRRLSRLGLRRRAPNSSSSRRRTRSRRSARRSPSRTGRAARQPGRGRVRTAVSISVYSVSGARSSNRCAVSSVVEDDLVVGDGRELYHGRSRRAATGRAHQRPENRHAGVDGTDRSTTGAGCGHVIAIAATIAAISSSVGVGRTSATCGATASQRHVPVLAPRQLLALRAQHAETRRSASPCVSAGSMTSST